MASPIIANQQTPLTKRYTFYVLGILWLVALFRVVDLQVMAVLLQSIKEEFQFSDTQLGVLTGFAFAVFYASLGIPIAWLADRYSRRNIISAAVGLWSLMTALCGMATGFTSLFFARMGVGVGEAGGYPPTAALLADYFPEKNRGIAFAVLGSAIPMGVFAGFLIGGVLNAYYGWRAVFYILGITGIVLAVVVRFTVRELPRGFSEATREVYKPAPFLSTLSYLWNQKSYRFIVLGSCLFTFGAYGSGVWIPTFFIRVHAMSTVEIGLWMAALYGGGGLLGTILGGMLGDRFFKTTGKRSWYLKISGFSLLFISPFAAFVYLWPNPQQALLVHLVVTILMHMNIGPVLAMVQKLSGVQRRTMGQAINVLVTNIIGLSLGPLIIGILSDRFSPDYGPIALGYAILALVVVAYTLSSVCFLFSGKWISKDLPEEDRTPGVNPSSVESPGVKAN